MGTIEVDQNRTADIRQHVEELSGKETGFVSKLLNPLNEKKPNNIMIIL